MRRLRFLMAGLVVLAFAASGLAQTKPATTRAAHNYARWEREISNYEKADQKQMPEKGGAVFIGSSSIARWKTLKGDFPGSNVINRGFGGSEIVDSTYYAPRIVFPYEPKQVFLRAGGNDIHAGKPAGEVFADYKDFVAKVHSRLPETEVVFIAQSPAPVRWKEREEDQKLNQLVKTWSAGEKHVNYVECYDISVTADGQAREDLFVADRLHFNEAGYKLMADRVRPFVAK